MITLPHRLVKLDKNQINAVIFGFLVLLLPVAVYLASNAIRDNRSKAAPTAQLTMDVKDQNGNVVTANPDNTTSVSVGQFIEVDISLSTSSRAV